MRLISQEGAVAYHDIQLMRYPNGEIGVEDVMVVASGEMLTQTLRRIALPLTATLQGATDRLNESDRLFVQHMNDFTKMTDDLQNGRNKEALARFQKMPAELQKNRFAQLLAIRAAQDGDEALYLAELERYRKNHPNDPAIDILSLDYYFLKKQYKEMFAALDRLDKSVGGDPYLTVLRGSALTEMGKLGEARATIEKAIEAEPTLEQAYWGRLLVSLKEKKPADTLTWLKKMKQSTGAAIDAESIANNAEFAEFVKSPQFAQFKTWLATQPKK
jgi:tetratricopeptide (TPR) repeat protein